MSQQPRTLELASSILEHTTAIETFLQQNGLPSPSFNPGAPPKLPLPPAVEKSLEAALSAMDELTALLLGPMGWLLNQIGHGFDLASLHAMYRYQMPTKFPVGSQITVEELSQRCCGNEAGDDAMNRLIQHAVSNYLFLQPSPGGPISHSALSAMMAHNRALEDWVGAACEDMWPSAAHLVEALALRLQRHPNKHQQDHHHYHHIPTGHNLAEQTEIPFFQTLRGQPERMRRFANSMTVMQNSMPGYDASAALEAYDWAGLFIDNGKGEKLVVVDVGGGQNGEFAGALASRFPDLIARVVVQDLDLPEVKDVDRELGLDDDDDDDDSDEREKKVLFMGHDFFQPQPVAGADVYFFRMVLHDWPDDMCVQILRQTIPALEKKKKGGRVLINDLCVPAAATTRSRYLDRQMRCQDLAMMAMFNCKERSEREWRELVQRADTRFKVPVDGVKQLDGSPLAVIEVIWDESVSG